MPNLQGKSRTLLTIAAVAVSVLLFACGQERKGAESADVPVRPRVSEAGLAVAAPQPAPEASPADGPPAARQARPETPIPPPPAAPESEPEPDAERPPGPPEAGGSRVYSNKDLRRYTRVKEEFGLDRDVVTVDLTSKDPATEPQGGAVLTDEQRDEEMRETMKRIKELNAEAAYLRSRIPSLHNPFLARVRPSEADATAEAGMDNAQRLARVNERLSQVDSQLDQLQRRLAELHQVEPGNQTP